ncbi:MAG: class I SAM-dependent methyltransferase [Bacillota bacterium]
MTAKEVTAAALDWAKASGDIWARRWADTDAALAGLSPHLLAAICAAPPHGSFKAFEIGCGPGSTTLDVAEACPAAEIVACDISASLAAIAAQRLAGHPGVRVVVGDAQALAPAEAPIDFIFSRHGVMFFEDPVRAFTSLRSATSAGGRLVFSCFRSWELNPWASELASAAAGRTVAAPGREPGGFAFADPEYVSDILASAGWSDAKADAVDFTYHAAEGQGATASALSFLSELGPAARILESFDGEERSAGLERMQRIIEGRFDGRAVAFPAAAWIWSASAG